MNNFKANDRVVVSGDSSELWIKDYNVRVCTHGIVLKDTEKYDKKVLVRLRLIDGDSDVVCYVRRSRIKPHIMYSIRVYKEQYSFDNYNDSIYQCKESEVNFEDIRISEGFCSGTRLLEGWKRLLDAWEGWTYCVKDVVNDKVVIGGIFDPTDIEQLNAFVKFYFGGEM